MKFCTKCGAQINDDAKFCNKCGNPLPNEVDGARQDVSGVSQQNETGYSIKPQGAGGESKKFDPINAVRKAAEKSKLPRKKLYAVIAAAAAGVFLIVLFAAILPALSWRNADNFMRILQEAADEYGMDINPLDWEKTETDGGWIYTYKNSEDKEPRMWQYMQFKTNRFGQVERFLTRGSGIMYDFDTIHIVPLVTPAENSLILGLLMINPELSQKYDYDLADKDCKLSITTFNLRSKEYIISDTDDVDDGKSRLDGALDTMYFQENGWDGIPVGEEIDLGGISIFKEGYEGYDGLVSVANYDNELCFYTITINYN